VTSRRKRGGGDRFDRMQSDFARNVKGVLSGEKSLNPQFAR
jgi:hypothetical protein